MADTLAERVVTRRGSRAGTTRRGRPRRPGSPGEPRRVGYLYVLPALAVYGAFLLFPLAHSVWLSFFAWDGLTLGTWVGLDNYRDLVADEQLRAAFGHAATLVVFYAVFPVCFGLVLASAMNRVRMRGVSFVRTVLFLPQVVAMVVVAVSWRQIYAPDGPLNGVLRSLGLEGLARPWLGDYALALPAVGLVGTWVETGLATVLFLAGTSRIPGELYEAARIDGAGAVQEFFAVTLPSVRRELAIALTLTVIAALRTFDLVYVTTRGGPGTATSVPSFEVYHRAFEIGQVGSAAAIGVTLTVLIFAVSLGVTRLAERGAT